MSDHPDLEKLDSSVREIVREVFRDPANGTPNHITKEGCLALANKGQEAWNGWRNHFPARKTGFHAQYLNKADFSQNKFHVDRINFSKFIFGKGADFSMAKFYFRQDFQGCKFDENTSFAGAVFETLAFFNDSNFNNYVNFNGASFCSFVNFANCKFIGDTEFIGAKFENALFKNSVFNDVVNFSNAHFNGEVDFGSDEATGAVFSNKALFQGVKISQSVDFRFARFELPCGESNVAESFRSLKLEYSKQHAIKEENRFFRLEMGEETERAKGFERYLYQRYAKFSDYGFSVSKPIRLFVETLLVYLLLYGLLTIPNCKPQYCEFSFSWIEFTLVQAFPLPGLDKLSETLRDTLYPRTGGFSVLLTIAVILHKAFSLLALFLMGLGLRNLFKLK